MSVIIRPCKINGTIPAVPSKSYAHRILIAAALSDAGCNVLCRASSDDIDATVRCLNALGADISRTATGFAVRPIKKVSDSPVLDCGESGSTLRFMLPVACALGANARFEGKGRLPQRPLGELTDCLKAAGISFSADGLPFSATGKLTGDVFETAGNVSSQYISGMLFAMSALPRRTRLVVKGDAVSRGYIDMTLDVLSSFGAKISALPDGYVSEPCVLTPSSEKTEVEGDWSNAAFMLVAGVLAGDVTVTGLNPESSQKDRLVADILKAMGGDIEIVGNSVRARKSALYAVVTDVTDTPDLAPVLSVAMAAAKGTSVMTGVSRLRQKESDRLSAVTENLAAMGIRSETDGDTLTIHGGTLKPFSAKGYNDHRMVMSASVAALVCGGEIDDGAPVAKSYPRFFEDLKALGGETV